MDGPDHATRRYKSPSDLTRNHPPPPGGSPTTATRTARITSSSSTTTTSSSSSSSHISISSTARLTRRNAPYLPSPTELSVLLAYPALLVFGTLFSLLSPQTRAATAAASHDPHILRGSGSSSGGGSGQYPVGAAPSYFARKDNLFNILFVKRGWAWITGAFVLFLATHPALLGNGTHQGRVRGRGGGEIAPGGRGKQGRVMRAAVRWAAVTLWWVFVTQWFFGPAIIDRGFRWSGGRCEAAEQGVRAATSTGPGEESGGRPLKVGEVVTAAACKASGGSWRGGHDISGHVFLLVLGSFFLVQEVGWAVARWARLMGEERCVVMRDGAVKGASVEAERGEQSETEGDVALREALGLGGKVAAVVVGLCGWMLLMTAIYFHTWFEKLTGLLVAYVGLYVVYILPRWSPALRSVVGLPGI